MNRRERQAAILRLVQERALSTQAELAQALRDEGHEVVQTTVSRDVTEIGLVKVRAPSGRLIYAAPGTGDADRLRAIGAAMRRYATGVEAANSGLVVVSTPVRLRERAGAGDRRGRPSVDRRDARRRQHDLHRGQGRDDGRTSCTPSWRPTSRTESPDDPLVGPGRRLARPGGLGLPPRRRRGAPPLRLRGELPARAAAARAGLLPTPSSPRRSRGWPRSPRIRPAYLDEDEDVHSAIERLLGELGRKIHAGRSRNDQVAAAFRLYVLDACAEAREEIEALALVVLSFAEEEADTLLPGYTHLQRGQPVTLGHHLLAWVEMLDRDRTRFAAAAAAAAESPLGAGALAGSTLGLPGPAGPDAELDRRRRRPRLRARLPLRRHRPLHAPLADRRGDRALVVGRVRLREAARERRHRVLDDAPEAEPRRRRARPRQGGNGDRTADRPARHRKGLPLAYDRDLQEDKAPVFAARATRASGSRAMAALVAGLEVDRERMAAGRLRPARARDRCRGGARAGRRAVPRGARAGGRERARRVVHAGRNGGRERCRAWCARPRRCARGARRGAVALQRSRSEDHSRARTL